MRTWRSHHHPPRLPPWHHQRHPCWTFRTIPSCWSRATHRHRHPRQRQPCACRRHSQRAKAPRPCRRRHRRQRAWEHRPLRRRQTDSAAGLLPGGVPCRYQRTTDHGQRPMSLLPEQHHPSDRVPGRRTMSRRLPSDHRRPGALRSCGCWKRRKPRGTSRPGRRGGRRGWTRPRCRLLGPWTCLRHQKWQKRRQRWSFRRRSCEPRPPPRRLRRPC